MSQVAPANRAMIPKYHLNRESRHNRSVVTLWNLPRPLKGLRVSEPWFRMSAPEIGNVPRLRPTLGRQRSGMEATHRSLRWAAPGSDFGPFSQDEGIFDVHAEVPDSVLDLRVAQQDLDRPKVPGGLVDH